MERTTFIWYCSKILYPICSSAGQFLAIMYEVYDKVFKDLTVEETFSTWVSSFPEGHRLVAVLYEVLNVTHLVVNGDQVLHCHISTHFNPG